MSETLRGLASGVEMTCLLPDRHLLPAPKGEPAGDQAHGGHAMRQWLGQWLIVVASLFALFGWPPGSSVTATIPNSRR
jgi:hypothetical protein